MASLRRLFPLCSSSINRTTFSASGAREGFGGSFIRGYSVIASCEQTVLRPHDEVGSVAADTLAIDDDELTKIRCEFDAARKSFHKIPEALKEMPKMNPERSVMLTCVET
uniref:Uncharacterized protein n=1 Tax=Fagus sylvatica TaxID=28930 RepID=A0A2N9HEK0_FAGSY